MNAYANLLIVEDEPELRAMLVDIATQIGLTAVEAGNGREAIEVLKQTQVDAIASDIQMPKMDGLAFLANLRTTDSDTPVIILTGFSTGERIVEALRLGATDFLDKPFEVAEVERVFTQCVGLGTKRAEIRRLNRQALAGDAPLAERVEKVTKMARLLQVVHNQKRRGR